MAKSNKRPMAVFETPTKIGDFLTEVGAIYLDIKNGTAAGTFVVTTPTNAVMITNLGNVATAETTALTKVPGAAGQRDIKYNISLKDVHTALAMVQQQMDNAPDVITAEAICHASGFELRVNGVIVKAPIKATISTSPGLVDLAAKAAGRGITAAYNWDKSIDAGVTWIRLRTTVIAKAQITGLASVPTLFRVQTVTSAGEGAWFQSNSVTPQ